MIYAIETLEIELAKLKATMRVIEILKSPKSAMEQGVIQTHREGMEMSSQSERHPNTDADSET